MTQLALDSESGRLAVQTLELPAALNITDAQHAHLCQRHCSRWRNRKEGFSASLFQAQKPKGRFRCVIIAGCLGLNCRWVRMSGSGPGRFETFNPVSERVEPILRYRQMRSLLELGQSPVNGSHLTVKALGAHGWRQTCGRF